MRLPSCCNVVSGGIECREFSVAIPTQTTAQRAAALENGFLVERERKLFRGLRGRPIAAVGSAAELRCYFLLAALLVLSASGPLTLAASFALATAATSITLAPLVIVVALVATNLCHELGHLAALAVASPTRPHVHLVARLGFAHIVRSRLAPGPDIIVIVSGPCCVAIGCLALMPFAPHPLVIIVLTAIGAAHIVTLLLPTGDGANLRDALIEFARKRS